MRARRPARPTLWPVAALATLLLGISFLCLQLWLERGRLSDVPVYHGYGELLRAGRVPYRDFAMEYPPAALPAFLVPSYLPWSYPVSFAVLMGLCGAGCIVAAATILRTVGASPLRSGLALLLLGVSPVVLGSLFDTRFDLWPAVLVLFALAALLDDRPLLAGGLGGLGFAAKLWPATLAPLGLAYLWRRRGRRTALGASAAFLAATAACVVPFAALAPDGVWHSVSGQLGRPLQVESLGAALLMAAEQLGGPSLQTVTSHGSQTLAGPSTGAVAAASTAVQALAVVGIWTAFARRRRPGPEAMLLASAAAVTALVAFGKVFSPQFLIWLVPLVLLVGGLRGPLGSLLLCAALLLTSAWFPGHYWPLALDHASPWSWLLLARDLAVVGLAIVLAWPGRLQHELLGEHRARLEALRSIRSEVE